jgi:preprotein translocase subunit YajC
MLVHSVDNQDTSLSILDAVEATVDNNAIIQTVKKGLTNAGVPVLGVVVGVLILCLFFMGYLLWSRRRNGNEKSKRKAHYW